MIILNCFALSIIYFTSAIVPHFPNCSLRYQDDREITSFHGLLDISIVGTQPHYSGFNERPEYLHWIVIHVQICFVNVREFLSDWYIYGGVTSLQRIANAMCCSRLRRSSGFTLCSDLYNIYRLIHLLHTIICYYLLL